MESQTTQWVGGGLIVIAILLLLGLLPGIAVVPNLPGTSIAIVLLAIGTLLIGVARERRPI